MANDHVKMFTEEYGPIAEQVSKQTGIAPSVLLAQWGMESNYGRSSVGHFNFGNIKDFSGTGKEATDSKTKSVDKYLNFESPEAFGDYYANMMRRLYPKALNTGTDISRYTEGLRNGVAGSYFEDPNYEDAIRGAYNVTSKFYSDSGADSKESNLNNPFSVVVPVADGAREESETIKATPEPDDVVNPYVVAGTSALASLPNLYPKKQAEKLESAKDAVELANINREKALPKGTSYSDLKTEFDNRQRILDTAKNEFDLAKSMENKPLAPSGVSTNAPQAGSSPSTNQIITDSNVPTGDQHTRAIQGTTEDGVTGRARQTTYNERTSQIARNAANQQLVLQSLGQQGLVDPKKAFALTEGISGSTPSGVRVSPDLAGEIKNQAELDRRIDNDKIEQKRLARQNAGRAFAEANQAMKDSKAAQNTASKAEAAEELARRQLSRAKASPSFSRAAIGGIGGLQAARGINELANIEFSELIKRYQAGDRSPELLAALQEAASATAQTGFGAAATVPVIGKRTARIKGAGALGTLGMGLYEAYKALTGSNKGAQ